MVMAWRFLLLIFLVSGQLMSQADSLLTAVLWEETSGFRLRLNPYGSFEEDAGAQHHRAARYLMGRWEADSLLTRLTLAVDYFLGRKMIPDRYRREQDFFMEFRILKLSPEKLLLEDVLTGHQRHFQSVSRTGSLDAAERRAQKIRFKNPAPLELKLPDGFE